MEGAVFPVELIENKTFWIKILLARKSFHSTYSIRILPLFNYYNFKVGLFAHFVSSFFDAWNPEPAKRKDSSDMSFSVIFLYQINTQSSIFLQIWAR
jgi:hypothetical protein